LSSPFHEIVDVPNHPYKQNHDKIKAGRKFFFVLVQLSYAIVIS